METNAQSLVADNKQSCVSKSETGSLLSVKQDFSRLSSELSDDSFPSTEVPTAASQCDESTEADAEVSAAASEASDVADTEADELDEQKSNSAVQRESPLDESCHLQSTHPASQLECCNSPKSDVSDTPRCDKICQPSSIHREYSVQSHQLLEAQSKKTSQKRKSTQYTDDRCKSPPAQKLRHKTSVTKISPSQLIRTTSGTFIVQEVTQAGEMLFHIEYIEA